MRGRKEGEIIAHALVENGLGTTIRAWRRFHGLSVTELAIRAGFGENGRGYISRIEHGQIRHLGEERLQRIAEVLQLQSADLLLHRMPEVEGEVPMHDLDEAIIGGKSLLKECRDKSLDWARMQLLLAKLYYERALGSHNTVERHTAFMRAQHAVECSLLIFDVSATPQSFQEATQLRQEIGSLVDALVVAGSKALLKRCLAQSSDWARIHLLLAKFYCERATLLPDPAARKMLMQAQECIDAALPIFRQRQVQRSLKEASQLREEIINTIKQMDGL